MQSLQLLLGSIERQRTGIDECREEVERPVAPAAKRSFGHAGDTEARAADREIAAILAARTEAQAGDEAEICVKASEDDVPGPFAAIRVGGTGEGSVGITQRIQIAIATDYQFAECIGPGRA